MDLNEDSFEMLRCAVATSRNRSEITTVPWANGRGGARAPHISHRLA